MYLGDSAGVHINVTDKLKLVALCEKYKLDVNAKFTSIPHEIFIFRSRDRQFDDVYVSAFPGNCSALVISNVQHLYDCNPEVFDFAEELCKQFTYASLFVSGTSLGFVEFLEKRGYRRVYGNNNLHSGKDNYFLVKDIVCEEVTNE